MNVVRAVVIAALLLAACVVMFYGSRPLPSAPASFVKVQYWEKWTGPEAEQMRQIVDDFNSTVGRDKRIYVEFLSISGIAQKVLTSTAAGVPPDVAGLWGDNVVQYAAMDALEPLDELAAAHGITRDYYKPIYWNACRYDGRLWALVSTPWAILLHYNKEIFEHRAADLRAAGLDPQRPPRTIEELDRYAQVLTTYQTLDGRRRIICSGHQPMEPGWYIDHIVPWFGGRYFDPSSGELTINSDEAVRAFDWIAGYARRDGVGAVSEFRSGLGGFGSTQNPFLIGRLAMMQQGPWMANFIENLAPEMNRWNVPAEQLRREKDFSQLRTGMSHDEVIRLLGEPSSQQAGDTLVWDAGIRVIRVHFGRDNRVAATEMPLLPAMQRRKFCKWAAAPFPSAVPRLDNVAFCGFDSLVIPRGARHKKEAFEFIAFVNRRDVVEKLCSMHCKNSPLAAVSREFIERHPNPYIQVFEDAAASPNAFSSPQIPVWSEISAELTVAAQKCYLLEQSPTDALQFAADRAQAKWDYFREVQRLRNRNASAEPMRQ